MAGDTSLLVVVGRRTLHGAVLTGDGPLAVADREAFDEIAALRRGDLGPLRRWIAQTARDAGSTHPSIDRIVLVAGPWARPPLVALVGERVDGVEVTEILDDGLASLAGAADLVEDRERFVLLDTDRRLLLRVATDEGMVIEERVEIAGSASEAEVAAAAHVVEHFDPERDGPTVVVVADAEHDVGSLTTALTAGGWVIVAASTDRLTEGAASMLTGFSIADRSGGQSQVLGPNEWEYDTATLSPIGAPDVRGDVPTLDPAESTEASDLLDRPTTLAGEEIIADRPTEEAVDRPTEERDRPTEEAVDRPTEERDRPTVEKRSELPPPVASPTGAAGPRTSSDVAADRVAAATEGGPEIPALVAGASIGAITLAGVAALVILGGREEVLPAAECDAAFAATIDADAVVALPSAGPDVTERWQVDLGGPSAVAPAIVGGIVVGVDVGSGDTPSVVRAFDARSGEQVWSRMLSGRVFTAPVVQTGSPDLVWITDDSGRLTAFDASGTELGGCSIPTAVRSLAVVSTDAGPALAVVGTEGGVVRGLASGRELWSVQTGDAVRSVISTPAGIAAVTDGGELLILDPDNGAIRVRTGLGGSASSPLLVLGDDLVFATADGEVVRVTTGGEEVWRTTLDREVRAPLATVDGDVFVPSVDGSLVRVDGDDGTVVDEFDLDAAVDGGVAALDGGVATGDDLGRLVIRDLRTDEPLAIVELNGAVNGGLGVGDDLIAVVDSGGILRVLEVR
ncbi:MAG: PQQ-binding-like beta-propeller repeat protein [Acidimicrobiales bacterium]